MAFESLSITGSLLGTSSWAITASRAVNLLVTSFTPFAGTGSITGSLVINQQQVSSTDFTHGIFAGSFTLGAASDIGIASTVRTSGSLTTIGTNTVTLQPGTYLVKWNLGASKNWSSNSGIALVNLVDSSNTPIGSKYTSARINPYPNGGSVNNYSQFGVSLLKLTTATTVKWRVTTATATFQLHDTTNSFTIEKILNP